MKNISKEIKNFFGAYFHQDCLVDSESWQEIVDEYINDWKDDECKPSISEEIEIILKTFGDNQLETILFGNLGCFYDPTPDMSVREWLSQIADKLQEAGM